MGAVLLNSNNQNFNYVCQLLAALLFHPLVEQHCQMVVRNSHLDVLYPYLFPANTRLLM